MKEGFHCFSENKLSLEDMSECIARAGYTTHISNSPDKELFVAFVFNFKGKNQDTFFSWSDLLTDVSQLDPKDQTEIRSVNLNPKTLFSGEYMKLTLPNVTNILKPVLNCYGGYVHFEFGFYNVENLDNALNDASTYKFIDIINLDNEEE